MWHSLKCPKIICSIANWYSVNGNLDVFRNNLYADLRNYTTFWGNDYCVENYGDDYKKTFHSCLYCWLKWALNEYLQKTAVVKL